PRLHLGVFPDDAAGNAQVGRLDLPDELRRPGEGGDVERLADVNVVPFGQVEDALGNKTPWLVREALPLVLPHGRNLDSVDGNESVVGQIEGQCRKGIEYNQTVATGEICSQSNEAAADSR